MRPTHERHCSHCSGNRCDRRRTHCGVRVGNRCGNWRTRRRASIATRHRPSSHVAERVTVFGMGDVLELAHRRCANARQGASIHHSDRGEQARIFSGESLVHHQRGQMRAQLRRVQAVAVVPRKRQIVRERSKPRGTARIVSPVTIACPAKVPGKSLKYVRLLPTNSTRMPRRSANQQAMRLITSPRTTRIQCLTNTLRSALA